MVYNMWNFSDADYDLPESDLYLMARQSVGKTCFFPIGDNIQNGNTLVIGTTRTGKTVFVKNMAIKLREQYPDALFVFFDVKKDYLSLCQKDDYVFSFYDMKCGQNFQWSLIEECLRSRQPYDEVREIVSILFEGQDDTAHKFFNEAAKEIFIAYCKTFLYMLPEHFNKTQIPSNRDIIQIFNALSFQQLKNRIKLLSSQETLCDELLPETSVGTPTKMAEGVLAVLRNFLSVFSGNFCGTGRDSVRGFMKKTGKAVFLEFDYSRQRSSALFFRLFLKMLIQQKLSADTDKEKKIYLFLDETAVLNGDYDLVHAINVGAGDGIRVILVAQSIDHIYMQAPAAYNEHYGTAAIAGFSNMIVFRPNDPHTIEVIQQKFGKANNASVIMPLSRYQPAPVEYREEYLVKSQQLMALGVGDVYIKIKEGYPQRIHFMEHF